MKRLAALLLVLMLPCGALAETFKLTVRTEMSEAFADELVQMLTPAGTDAVVSAKEEILLQIVQRVADGFTLELTMQQDAVVGHVYMGGGELMDMAVYNLNGMSYLISSMIPGYALAERAPDSAAVTRSTDWAKVAASTEEAIHTWLAECAPVTTYGTFTGDAYDGGARCTTWIFSEKDVAALFSRILPASDFSADDVFKYNDATLNGGDDAGYSFILRMVDDAAEEPIGVSLIILRGDEQIASVSLGACEISRIVVGLGLPTENYWWESTLHRTSLGDVMEYSGISREWTASKAQSFAYVQASSQPKAQYGWSFTTKQLTNASKLHATLFPIDGASKGKTLLAVEVNLETTEQIPPMPDGLTICANTDLESYEALMNQFAAALAARMIKLLPMDLIFRLNMLP